MQNISYGVFCILFSFDMTNKWLSVVGIGEDGLSGLNAVALSLINNAAVIFGGSRHLAILPKTDLVEKLVWKSPITASIAEILNLREKQVCVLASGDPMCFGIGVTLTKQIPLQEMIIIPAPSAFSLACSRLGWSLTEVEILSLCSRPAALVESYIYPGAKLLILSEGKNTPAVVADILTKRGFGQSKITVLERMGGDYERLIEVTTTDINNEEFADLNVVAVDCIAAGIMALPRLPGLPDIAYHHDGQLTKREVRAITLTALAPIPGQLLWDIGAGCGSISIEWMRSHSRCRAIAIEQNPSRLKYIADNAFTLGTPNLQIIEGTAASVLNDLPQPDAIFIGGGVTATGLFEVCWQALKPGGRMVANVVTIEGEQKLFQWQELVGGELTRIAIQRAQPIGKFLGWKAMAPVTQWVVVKP